MANLDWLVVRDFVADRDARPCGRTARRSRPASCAREDIATEVFFLPAAAHTEKDGSFTNTQRMLQWHHKAVEPAGRRAQRPVVHLPPGPAASGRSWPAPTDDRWTGRVLDLTWDYPVDGPLAEPSRRGGAGRDQRLGRATAQPLSGVRAAARTTGRPRAAAGSTAACYAGGVNQAARRKPGGEQNWVAPEWGWAWPANRRILYNRASADPDGKPWSERKALRLVGRRGGQVDRARRAGLRRPTRPPDYRPPDGRDRGRRDRGRRPVHHAGRRQGVAVRPGRAGRRAAARALRAAGVAVRATRCTASSATRSGRCIRHPENPLQPERRPSRARRCSRTWPPPTG